MKMAWKEINKSKAKFIILGSIVFLVSLLTFIISGLANGLSMDNAALIKDMPAGQFYMDENAKETYNLSKIDEDTEKHVLKEYPDAAAFSIQMGFVVDGNDDQHSVSFVTSTESDLFENVNDGEIILDRSMQEDGIQVGDKLTNNQYSGEFTVKGFVDQKKYSHTSVAFISMDNYKEMYRTNHMQLLFIPGQDKAETINGLEAFSNTAFLDTIPSYSAEQMSLNMIIWFLVIISGMLFAIFFYMMNVQKIGLYGILKAIGVKTRTLFGMMWSQMLLITAIALVLSVSLSHLFNRVAPDGMPFDLGLETTLQLSGLFIVIGFIGATLSGIQIKRVEPLQAIQQGEM